MAFGTSMEVLFLLEYTADSRRREKQRSENVSMMEVFIFNARILLSEFSSGPKSSISGCFVKHR